MYSMSVIDFAMGGDMLTVKEMRLSLGMTQKEFSEEYKIPYRTVQNWETGDRKPPDYVIELLERVVRQDYSDRLKGYADKFAKLNASKG